MDLVLIDCQCLIEARHIYGQLAKTIFDSQNDLEEPKDIDENELADDLYYESHLDDKQDKRSIDKEEIEKLCTVKTFLEKYQSGPPLIKRIVFVVLVNCEELLAEDSSILWTLLHLSKIFVCINMKGILYYFTLLCLI